VAGVKVEDQRSGPICLWNVAEVRNAEQASPPLSSTSTWRPCVATDLPIFGVP
jgi:hypothetical protein